MTKPVRLSLAAREELLAAARWYGNRDPGLRADFLAAVDDVIARVARYAHHLGPAPGIAPSLGWRITVHEERVADVLAPSLRILEDEGDRDVPARVAGPRRFDDHVDEP